MKWKEFIKINTKSALESAFLFLFKKIVHCRNIFSVNKNILTYFISFFCFFSYSQQKTSIDVSLDTVSNSFIVNQKIVFKNSSEKAISKIVLNDWINAYSDKNSNLAKRFSDEYVRAFHFATDKERGKTTINSITENNINCNWQRIKNQVDLIEIILDRKIEPLDTITLDLKYILKVPNARFTSYGFKNGNIYINNPFLSVAKQNTDGSFVKYSNENLEDIVNAPYLNIDINFSIPENYYLSTNLNESKNYIANNKKIYELNLSNATEIQLAIEKKTSFEIFSNEIVKIETNLYSSKINQYEKAIIIDKVTKFIKEHLNIIPQEKLLITQVDYEREPVYGLNQLPSFLSPFKDDFIYEIKFIKSFLYHYLKAGLKIDFRKEGYIFDAYQTYYMIRFIQENYPDQKLLGNLSGFKILKGYHLANIDFNEQYSNLYLFMARKNLDQALGQKKDTFIKFNEQISNKAKTGAAFNYLDKYLEDNSVEKSFKEFLINNQGQFSNALEFENIFKKNATKNIDWFFPNYIYTNNLIDYKFGKIQKNRNETSIKVENKYKNTSPILISGEKNGKIIFEKWLNKVENDTIITFKSNEIDKITLNKNNALPEFNNRNNYKSFKGIFNRPIKFNFLVDLEDPRYNQIFYTPELGYNLYDGFLFSLTLKNTSLLEKPVRYFISPTYSSNTQSLVGNFGFVYNQIIRNKSLYAIQYGVGGSTYHYIQDARYYKFTPSLQFKFRNPNLISNERHFLTFGGSILNKEKSKFVSQNSETSTSAFSTSYNYSDSENNRAFGYGITNSISNDFGKVTFILGYRKLFASNYQITARMFNGYFYYNNGVNAFGLDTPKDIFFDYNLYGRSESTGFFSQQLVIAEGGFKSKLNNPYGDKWMSSLNINSSIWHWIQCYGDIAIYQNKNQKMQWGFDTGIHFNILPDYLELFFPVYSSNGLEITQNNYHQKIRFVATFSPNTLIKLFTRKWF